MIKVKAVLLNDKNKWRETTIGEIDIPAVKLGEVLIEVHATGVNPVDYKTATDGMDEWNN